MSAHFKPKMHQILLPALLRPSVSYLLTIRTIELTSYMTSVVLRIGFD